MSFITKKNICNKRNILIWSAILMLLALIVWRSKLELKVLFPFIVLGVIAAFLLSLLKQIRLSRVLIFFSAIISSLICCGLYCALTILLDRYLIGAGSTILNGNTLTVASDPYTIVGFVVAILAYPAVLVAIIWFSATIIRGFESPVRKELYFELRTCLTYGKPIRNFFILLFNLLLAVGIGVLLICGAYSLPPERISRNTASSADLFLSEGTYPSLYRWCFSRLDNFTDALILLEAADEHDSSGIEDSLLNYNGSINGCDPAQTLYAHYAEGKSFDFENAYPRYWHGNLVIVKPLLQVLNYEQIRFVNFAAQIMLVFLICFLLTKRSMKSMIIPFLLSYLMMMPSVIGKSMQFSSCFYVSMITTAALLCKKYERGSNLLFLYTGAATAYFDLLTFPIITLGIPVTVYLYVFNDNSASKNTVKTLMTVITWCIGYAGMWISKWILAEAFTDYPVISDSIRTLIMRTSGTDSGEELISVFTVFGKNTIAFLFNPVIIPIAAILIIFLMKSIKDNQHSAIMLPTALISLLPFIWYAFAGNHSYIHYWFTCKSLTVSVFAILCSGTAKANSKLLNV